jgi:Protein of unknown function (DUF2752)
MSLATEHPVAGAPSMARMRGPALGAVGAASAALALRLRDPHVSHAWGVCPLYYATGIYCPGCGGLRAVNDLTHGHLAAAASSNLLLVGLVPVLGLLYARWTLATWRGTDIALLPRVPRAAAIGLVVLVVAFVVARNVPGSWLAP